MKKFLVFCFISFLSFSLFSQNAETRLMRFPDIYGDKIVFSYAGDLYLVSDQGGLARRLTSHEGLEIFPRFSPDGKHIAFTAQYDGNSEVYIMPAEGGIPKRITYTACLNRDDISDRMGPNNIVMTWTNDSKNVVYRTRGKSFNDFKGQLFLAPVDGGMSEQLPLAYASWCSYSPDGNKLALNQVFREFRTWKYYKGGMADDIWIFDFKTKKIENITNNVAQDIFPMWHENKIYFLSDRDRTMNLFVYDLNNKNIEKLTNFTDFDIKFPSLGKGYIVFENGGYIYKFNLNDNKLTKLQIQIQEDFANSRNIIKDVSKSATNVHICPDGSRLTLSARGDIFSVPAKNGITKNLTQSSNAHDRNPVWSPDGKYIAYLSDKSGEYQIYIQEPDKVNSEKQLTNFEKGYIYKLVWSPDSKNLLWNTKSLELNCINIETKAITTIHKSIAREIYDYTWSPDNNWVAFSDEDENRVLQIYLYNIKDKKEYKVTSQWYNSYSPHFSHDGKYLFFISNRDFNPIYSAVEWNIAYQDMSRIYFLTLNSDIKSPFANENIEVFGKDTAKKDDKAFNLEIKNIENRIAVLPMLAGNFRNLNYVNGKLYFVESRRGQSSKFKYYDLNEKKDQEIGDYWNYQISADRKNVLVYNNGNWYISNLPTGSLSLKESVSFSDLKINIDLKAEWQQIYFEAWRQMRDFLYDPNLHQVDWEKQKNKYAELLPYVNSRNDLNYIIGELIGELNVGHAYVGGGDRKEIQRIKTGLLGAEFEKDKSGYFKITKIYQGENWRNNLTSPLTGIGLDINENDYITSINGQDLKEVDNIFSVLIDQADKMIEIEVSTSSNGKNAKKYFVKPISDEADLIYFNWVRENIRKVNEATDGKVGYIHVPDMSVAGLNEFMKYYYPQLSKQALIIDDRGNGGGNVSPMLIERLRRELSIMGMQRDVPLTNMKPRGMLFGPKVLLLDNYSASDGDLFPYQFKRHELGVTVGQRSWGGVVGIRGSLPFIDGATLSKPEFAHFDENGWIIEGYGVDPDVVVENDPYQEFLGNDQQLNEAIKIILQEIEKFGKTKPAIPDFPDKSK